MAAMGMISMRTCLCLVVVCLLTGSARADDSRLATGLGADAQPAWLDDLQPVPEREWYGWQALAGDAVGLAALATAASLSESTGASLLGLGGLASYALVAPVSHAAHGRWGAAAGSLGLRSLPILWGAAAAAEWEPLATNGTDNSGFQVLALLALTAPILLDAAVLSYEDAPARSEEASMQVAPWVSRDAGGLLVGRRF